MMSAQIDLDNLTRRLPLEESHTPIGGLAQSVLGMN